MNQTFDNFTNSLRETLRLYYNHDITTPPTVCDCIASYIEEYVYPFLIGGPVDKAYFRYYPILKLNDRLVRPHLLRQIVRDILRKTLKNGFISVNICRKTKRLIPVYDTHYLDSPGMSTRQYDQTAITWLNRLNFMSMGPDKRYKGRSYETSPELYYLILFTATAFMKVFRPDSRRTQGLEYALQFIDKPYSGKENKNRKALADLTYVCCVGDVPYLETLLRV